MRPVLIVTRGLPGCGKTDFALKWMRGGERRIRINRDDLRWTLFRETPPLPAEREELVTLVQVMSVRMSLVEGWSVCCDDTNLVDEHVELLCGAASGLATFEVHDLRWVPLETVIRRNALRSGTRAYVPPDRIREMAEEFHLSR